MDKEKNIQAEKTAQDVQRYAFMAINEHVESHIVSSKESLERGRDFVNWGPRNDFPEYLRMLYKNVATLNSIIRGCVNYISGNKVTGNALTADGKMNRKGDTIRQVVRKAAKDYETYGGFAFNVIRSNDGNVAEIYNVDIRFLRSNKENTVFYYSEDWSKRWGKSKDLVYAMYERDINWAGLDEEGRKMHASTIAYFKGEDAETYPVCPYEAAVKDCEIERMIEEFHLNDLNNGFSASYLINFLNGIPSEEDRDEIERKATKKLCGYQNASRLMLNFADSKEHMAVVQKLESTGFEERYQNLAKRSQQQIYAAFQASPNLFGIRTENMGFNSEEYESAFKLFNRTMITPVQIMIAEALESIYSAGLHITPFSLDTVGEDDNTATGGAAA